MIIHSTVIVKKSLHAVWQFLADPRNSPQWDRSINAVVISPDNPHPAPVIGVGTVVETVSPAGDHQTFRITVYDYPNTIAFALLDSPLFKSATLRFMIDSVPAGTRIMHQLEVRLRLRALFLYPILALTHKKALATDLEYLRRALDEGYNRLVWARWETTVARSCLQLISRHKSDIVTL